MTPEMCPGWFQGFNLAFQIIFFLVTLSIAATGYQVYRFFGREEQKFLTLGWAVLALSYVASVVSNTTYLLGGSMSVATATLYLHAYLFLAGIMVLLFAYLRIKEPAVRAVLLVLLFGVVALFTQSGQDMMFYTIMAALMLFIVAQLLQRYRETCNRATLLVAIGFSLLTLGQLAMILTGVSQAFYVVSALLMLGGFGSIAARRLTVT